MKYGKITVLSFLIFWIISGLLFSDPIFAQIPSPQPIPCGGQLKAWKFDRSPEMREFWSKYDCYCPDPNALVLPICTPKGTTSPSTGSYSVPLLTPSTPSTGSYGKQDLEMQMMQSFFGALFQNILQSVFAPPTQNSYQEQLKKQQEEQRRRMEERKKQEALNRWETLQKEMAFNKAREAEQKQKEAQNLLAKINPVSGGHLSPFKWRENKPELQFKPIGATGYSTAKFTQVQRLQCAAYFSSAALNAMKSGDIENARFLNEQADKVMTGEPTNVECRFPALPGSFDSQKAEAKAQELRNILSNLQKDVKFLQEIETKLYDVKERIKEASNKKESAEIKLKEAQNNAATVKPEEKANADKLVAEALAALQEAEKELADAKQLENELLKEKEKIENEIKDLEAKIQTLG